jgi:hypothetical protein
MDIGSQDKEEILLLLKDWYLYSEIDLLNNDDKLRDLVSDNTSTFSLLTANGFNGKGQYNWDRYATLMSLLRK